ncbi:MAG: carboxypeptidase regulatory-like domain-containing protein [Planctomycetia bacterium]|nr:carboxypeptidase regulatory-like domain-containing protein [Planctomycetia bacterium]
MRSSRVVAACLAATAVGAGLAWWLRSAAAPSPVAAPDDGSAGSVEAAPARAPDLEAGAPTPVPLATKLRRVTVVLDAPLAREVTDVAFARSDGSAVATDRGRFVRASEHTFVCDDPRPGLPTRAPPEVLVRRGDEAPIRVEVPLPRTATGAWQERYDVSVSVRAETLATLTGRVVTPEGAPVPGAWVEVWPTDAAAGGRRAAPVRSDDDGTFRVAVDLGAARSQEVRIEAVASALGWAEGVRATLEAGRTRAAPDLVVGAARRVRGRVPNDEHTPAWAHVAARPVRRTPADPETGERLVWDTPYTRPGEDGTFTLRGLPDGPVVLTATLEVGPFVNVHPDVAVAQETVVDAPTDDVALGARCRLLTFVADDEAGRIDEFALTIDGQAGTLHLRATPDRELDVVVPTDRALRLTVRAAGHAPIETALDAATSPDPVRLRLPVAAAIGPPPHARPDAVAKGGPWLHVTCGEGHPEDRWPIRANVRRRGPDRALVDVEVASDTPNGVSVWRGFIPRSGGRVLPIDGLRTLEVEVSHPRFAPRTVELSFDGPEESVELVHLSLP